MDGKGTIEYVYDAAGMKLKQVVHETGKPDKTTLYLMDAVYQNDTLQLVQHEEGRLVPEIDNTFTYQYNLKDHLGNTRLTFTTKPNSITFPATFETENSTAEEALYNNIAETRVPFNSADANSDGGNEVCRVNATTPTGAGISLPVSKGDTLDMKVYGYYEGGSGYSSTTPLAAFVASVAGAFGGLNGGTAPEQAVYDVFDNAYDGGAAAMLGTSNDNVPAAYLNYILFDENMISYQHGYTQISSSANMNHEELLLDDVAVTKRGFVYVYLTNESAIGNVYFDDMEVTVKESAVIQEDDYYPFGLAFNSWQRSTGLENKFLYNGKELDSELNLNWYHYGFRIYDPAMGRFPCADPIADKFSHVSPYNYAENEPVGSIDLWGLQRLKVNGIERTRHSTSSIEKIRTFGASTMHPIAASKTGYFKSGSTNISSVASRIARHASEGSNLSTDIGSERNALRHATWSAAITQEFGNEAALKLTNAHEGIAYESNAEVDFTQEFEGNLALGDQVADFLNNEIGRGIGSDENNKDLSAVGLAKRALEIYHTEGLYEASEDEEGNVTVTRNVISDEQYRKSLDNLLKLDQNGFSPNER